MDFGIDYLRAMLAGVETAVTDGLDRDATVAVALPEVCGGRP